METGPATGRTMEENVTSWYCLALTILLEVAGTTCMKLSQGFARPFPSVMVFIFYGLSLAALTVALKTIDLSVAYSIWCGLGAALVAAIGILWFKEPATVVKILSIALIIIGVVGLNLSGIRR